jgi:hypothetical protein
MVLFFGDEQSHGGLVVGVARSVCLDDQVGAVAALSHLKLL